MTFETESPPEWLWAMLIVAGHRLAYATLLLGVPTLTGPLRPSFYVLRARHRSA
jgi:hypothetical protein